MKVGDGVLIDASRLGMNGGQMVGVVSQTFKTTRVVRAYLPRVVEREMVGGYVYLYLAPPIYPTPFSPSSITATIPNCGHWLGKEMP